MQYIHDLTSTGDFSDNRSFNLPRFLRLTERVDGDRTTPPDKELVLTGDARTRQTKRYVLDYERDGNICDCCGRDINKKPWDFKKTSKLCDDCEVFLETTQEKSFWDNLDIVVGEDRRGFITKRIKPWDVNENEMDLFAQRRVRDNVLLWD